MHTPAGYEMHAGIAYPTDWWAVIFNPSFPYRFAHMMTAAYLTTSVVVLATGARYVVAGKFQEEARTMLHMGIGMLAILGPVQVFLGDLHGLNTLHYQPIKIAAIEAHWQNRGPADLVLFALPDERNERNRVEVAVPHLGSLILTHRWNGTFPGLKDVPPDQRPPVTSIFFSFRIMVAVGFALIALGLTGAFLWWRRRLLTSTGYLRIAQFTWPIGFIAILAGWLTTESGRQPYIAYGILRTDHALSPVGAATIATSLTAFVLIYTVVFSIGIHYIHELIAKGPAGATLEPAPLPEGLPNRPLSVADESMRSASAQEPPT
jgi:cytochrome bd ubiquinol oxidase subunit I